MIPDVTTVPITSLGGGEGGVEGSRLDIGEAFEHSQELLLIKKIQIAKAHHTR